MFFKHLFYQLKSSFYQHCGLDSTTCFQKSQNIIGIFWKDFENKTEHIYYYIMYFHYDIFWQITKKKYDIHTHIISLLTLPHDDSTVLGFGVLPASNSSANPHELHKVK